ncbi:MAG: heme biosynthesis HemY N-terminal domain-containing protein [Sulfurimicrobium sp.]|nr:heme biosynthesis HemY N-terminal domain-containing protein [Sulfurimicrobium sp.]MDO9189573.1 heme biosynthesis HemY N-terminal domain-containing protein [Sulfurimicrobium sp.]MDP1705943.1 heme biosynthesis HemY N-terminal domain-containing protein [Sulfurimicrobium sp.]MDP2197190.1 heme biosynthesis HemY N-terminal domain-containing protein [Sulfurimicrobium sp.]MDP2963269.1 heme biosynthesis HemY N-terminal domain-containing protein [Sulfurimicrobium sp.]
MKALFWTLAILLLAVALTIAATHNTGYVLLVYPPYRIELSLNLLLTLLAAAFFIAYGLLRIARRVLRLPAHVRAFKEQRQQDKARSAMTEGMQNFAAGNYAAAEKHAAHALELGETPELNALIAARAAHELKAFDRRDAYLAQAGKACADYPNAGMTP